MSLAIEQLLADAGRDAHEPRRDFDVAAGLRRLARDAGYTAAPPTRSFRRSPAPTTSSSSSHAGA